ncbi:MAG TPA: acyl carrier protein [Jatrophihabitans sp.]|nr:acyl carrier protein [Jatrophihabitans sp.]
MSHDSSDQAVNRTSAAEVSTVVQNAWSKSLATESIEPETHFFDFGGHSVAAMRVMMQLREALGVTLPTRLIFDHPVLSEFTEETVKRVADAQR